MAGSGEEPGPVTGEEGGAAAPGSPAGPAAPAAAPPERDIAFLVSAGIAVVAFLVLARNLLPVKQDLADSNRRIEALKAERDALRRERDLLERKEKALGDDPAYIERVLRGQTGMSKQGEFLVR